MRPPTDGAGTTLCAGYNESYAIRQLIYRQLMNTNSSKLPGASTNDPKTVTLTIIYDKVLTINLRTTANSQIQQLHQRQQHHLADRYTQSAVVGHAGVTMWWQLMMWWCCAVDVDTVGQLKWQVKVQCLWVFRQHWALTMWESSVANSSVLSTSILWLSM